MAVSEPVESPTVAFSPPSSTPIRSRNSDQPCRRMFSATKSGATISTVSSTAFEGESRLIETASGQQTAIRITVVSSASQIDHRNEI